MMFRKFKLALALVVVVIQFGSVEAVEAQESGYEVEEIVVTSQLSHVDLPAITLTKKADFLVQEIILSTDSRRNELRTEEIHETIRSMVAKANADPILTLGTGDNRFTPLTLENYKLPLSDDEDYDDSSYVAILLKAPLSEKDANEVYASINQFLATVEVSGRTQIETESEHGLSIINVQQYRNELLDLIAADAKKIVTKFGPGYAARILGLEEAISWQRQSLTTLALYIPYVLQVVPKDD